ncbi:hypothetical protein [Clostridium sp. C8-1-8]|uniref:hypothetical protein n=1 Tax=Clostridium sp. C8-1-8 TaxID=2698831 RepID=UPI00136EBF00|nr:hypothetical protein [Clostridium sp. C8-1-8]
MDLMIRNYGFFYNVIDQNNKLVAKIQNKHLVSIGKKIVDTTGKTIYTTDIINTKTEDEVNKYNEGRSYIICKSNKIVATAVLEYDKYEDKYLYQRFVFRIPKVHKINIKTDCRELIIKLKYDGSLLICEDNVVIGEMTSHFPFIDHYITCNEINDQAFLAALYILAKYMVDENNILII